MNPETLKALVEIFQGVGAGTKEIVVAVLIFHGAKFLIGMGVIIFVVSKVIKVLTEIIRSAFMASRFHKDLGYGGEIMGSQREHILQVWKKGLEIERANK